MKVECSKCGKLEDLYAMYCTHSGRGANGLCGAHDYNDLLCKNCFSPPQDSEAKLKAIETLVSTWENREKTYLQSIAGMGAKMTISLCIKEVKKILDGSYFKENSEC